MDIVAIVTWFQTNWGDLIKAYVAVVGVASIIVKLTPTLKDDNALKGVMRFLGKYIALNKSTGPKP